VKVTPKKSQHFQNGRAKQEDEQSELSETESALTKEESGYEDEDESAVPSSSEPESEAEDGYTDSDEDVKPKKRGRANGKGTGATVAARSTKGKELWREGVRAGLGPGNQVVIKKPKARDAGKTPYRDETIHPNTLLFLKDLKANNDREWLKMHDPDFRQSERDWKSFAECLTTKITEADDTVPELPFKDVVRDLVRASRACRPTDREQVFRIYRDVRFSSDPTPYKV
jgi:hypothetical protein